MTLRDITTSRDR